MLGRCLRRVLLLDAGEPRNAQAREMHGFLTRDGIPPPAFLGLARDDVARYPSIERRAATARDARMVPGGFEVTLEGGVTVGGRKLLLATGVVDELPPIEGLDRLYGTSVHHCPYCDAWEWRDQPLAVLGRGESASALAIALTWWSPDVVLCTNGPALIGTEHRERLDGAGVEIREDHVLRLDGRDGWLERLVFGESPPLPRRAVFVASGQRQRSDLAARLGCRFNERGAVDTGSCEATNVPGLYVAGDASKEAQFVIVAAAEGTEAGMAIHKALLAEELREACGQNTTSTPTLASRGGP